MSVPLFKSPSAHSGSFSNGGMSNIISSVAAGLLLKHSIVELRDAELIPKSCIFIWVFLIVSIKSFLGIKECHHRGWLQEKRDKTIFLYDAFLLSPLKCKTVLDAEIITPSIDSVCFSLKSCCASSVLIREYTVLCSNGGWHSVAFYSHLVKCRVIFFQWILYTFPWLLCNQMLWILRSQVVTLFEMKVLWDLITGRPVEKVYLNSFNNLQICFLVCFYFLKSIKICTLSLQYDVAM